MKSDMLRWFSYQSGPEQTLDHDDQEGLLEKELPRSDGKETKWCLLIVIFSIACISISGASWFWRPQHGDLDKLCSVYTSQDPSPIQDDIDIVYTTVQRNGSFMKETIYRGLAGPEVDAAWEALGTDYKNILIPEEKAESYGLGAGHVKLRKEVGGGFPAYVDALHLMHCLNLLRKASYYSYEYYHNLGHGPFSDEDEILRLHFGHCLDTLRQHLMCSADTGLLGMVWIEGGGTFVDFFDTNHKCKNYDDIRQWAEDHQFWPTSEDTLEKRPGDIILPEIP